MFDLDQLAADGKAYLMAAAELKRRLFAARKFKIDQRRDRETELELKLQDMAFHFGLPPTHRTVIMAVAYSASLDAERRDASKKDDDDDHEPNYPSAFGGFNW